MIALVAGVSLFVGIVLGLACAAIAITPEEP